MDSIDRLDVKLPIGGFFYEEPTLDKVTHNFDNKLLLKTARASLKLLLKKLKPQKVFIPFYQCEVVFDVLDELEINFTCYTVNYKLEPHFLPTLKTNELFIAINYFGLKRKFINELYRLYGSQLIVDNSQAFYANTKSDFMFNSARKYFGVSDGSILEMKGIDLKEFKVDPCQGVRNSYLKLLKNNKRKEAFEEYQLAEDSLDSRIEYSSEYSKNIISRVDHKKVKQTRKENYLFLDRLLKGLNKLEINSLDDQIPMCYPFLAKSNIERSKLLSLGIYFPLLWPNVLANKQASDIDKELAVNLFPLPIDQRWGVKEMEYIANNIIKVF